MFVFTSLQEDEEEEEDDEDNTLYQTAVKLDETYVQGEFYTKIVCVCVWFIACN